MSLTDAQPAGVSPNPLTLETYRRAAGVLWRDTGLHVVAFPTDGSGTPVVLGGGHAQLWRLLDGDRTLPDLVEHFRAADSDDADITAAVRQAVQTLSDQGFVEGDG